MEDVKAPTNYPEQQGNDLAQDSRLSNKKVVVLLSGFVALAAIILAASGYLYFRNSKPNYAYNNQYAAQASPTSAASPSITDAPVQVSTVSSKTDLDTVLNELNSTTDKDLQNDYNQAASEGKNF